MTESSKSKLLPKEARWSFPFSICCLVSNWSSYKDARGKFAASGFSEENSEFLVCDNSEGNRFDAFEACRIFLREARGRYVLIAHQDAYPLESVDKLRQLLSELDKADPAWGIAGNAGVTAKKWPLQMGSLKMPAAALSLDEPFKQVSVVDENAIIVRNGCGITVSSDLTGYHFYGLDICSVASRLGLHSYVLDYLWYHASEGTIGCEFFASKRLLQSKLAAHYSVTELPTTCTHVSWSPSLWKRAVSVSKSFLQIAKRPQHGEARRELIGEGMRNPLFLPALAFSIVAAIPKVLGKISRRRRDVSRGASATK
jgi:hypothetical protein